MVSEQVENDPVGMQVVCPDCEEVSKLDAQLELKCGKCESTFNGYKFAPSKNKISIGLGTFAVVLILGNKIDDKYLDKTDRYPLNIEYQVVDICTRGDTTPQSVSSLSIKRNICSCALENVQKTINYQRFNASEQKFWVEFERQAKVCSAK